MSLNNVNQKIIEIWNKHNGSKRAPLFYPELKKEMLLFVGLNPSFSSKGFSTILKGTDYEKNLHDLEDFYNYENFNNHRVQDYQNIELISREKHPYFARFREISEYLEVGWEQVNLILIRNTNQKTIKSLMKSNESFLNEQIDLMINLIFQLNPKIVIVENALASRWIQERLKLDFSEELGTYMKDNTPVFYSGMLTGKRALDLGSLKRLNWHIKCCLKKGLES